MFPVFSKFPIVRFVDLNQHFLESVKKHESLLAIENLLPACHPRLGRACHQVQSSRSIFLRPQLFGHDVRMWNNNQSNRN